MKLPYNKSLVKESSKRLDVIIPIEKEGNVPNADTIAAMNELKEGKGKKFKSVEELFNSI